MDSVFYKNKIYPMLSNFFLCEILLLTTMIINENYLSDTMTNENSLQKSLWIYFFHG